MCLVALAIHPAANPSLVLVANRDEYHERPADPAAWWSDRPHVLGGRDRRAGGTWLGASRAGRFAVVLNDARRARPAAAPSRGELVPGFLEAEDGRDWLAALADMRARYAGFHLVAGDAAGVCYVSSGTPAPIELEAGIHVVDNSGWDSGTPRARRARACLAGPLEAGGDPAALMAALADRADPGPGEGDCRPVFLADSDFGTRCSTVLVLGGGSRPEGRLVERRYDARASATGSASFTWPLERSGPS